MTGVGGVEAVFQSVGLEGPEFNAVHMLLLPGF